MTTVRVDPGICGFVAKVTAESEDQMEVKIQVASDCAAISAMMHELGEVFDAFEICLTKPGTGPMFDYAREKFPIHAACPVISGILKCVEVECGLALKRDVSVSFL
ncbi:MAG: hypothetical protein N2Z65_03370 [Clostridiales bacterium]|nr:hypothetical protein [Clostridiales bacterium]